MARVSKFVMIGVGSIIGIVLIASGAGYVYLQSSTSRSQMEAALGRAIGLPVAIREISIGLPASVLVRGATVPQADPKREGNFLEVDQFTATLRPLALLGRRLEVTKIEIVSPRLRWFQNEKGKWRLPELPKAEPPPVDAAPKTTPAEVAVPSKRDERPGKGAGKMEFALSNIGLESGGFIFFDRDGAPVFLFEGVDAKAPKASADEVSGSLTCAKIVAVDALKFTDNRSSFTYRNGDLRIDGLDAALAGGSVNGEFRIQTETENSPFGIGFAFKNVDLGRLAADAGWADVVELSGSVDGYFSGSGIARDVEEMEGNGQITSRGARIRSFGFLMALAQAFGIPELADMQVERAQANFRVGDEKVWVDYLVLDGRTLVLDCWGKAKMNGKLDLDARLTVAGKLFAQIPAFLKSNFELSEDGTKGSIRFEIGGTVEKPKSDLVEKIVGKKIEEQAVNLIKNLLGAPEDKEEPRKRPGH